MVQSRGIGRRCGDGHHDLVTAYRSCIGDTKGYARFKVQKSLKNKEKLLK